MLEEGDLDQYCLLKTTPAHLKEVAVGTEAKQPELQTYSPEEDRDRTPIPVDETEISFQYTDEQSSPSPHSRTFSG